MHAAFTSIPPARFGSEAVRHVQLRLRMLHGLWSPDLQGFIRETMGPTAAKTWGYPMAIVCPMADLPNAVSVLYDDPIEANHPDEPNTGVQARLDAMQSRQVLQRAQVLTECTNECARFIYFDESDRMLMRAVSPNLLDGISDPARPGIPVLLGEWMQVVDNDRRVWAREVWDVRDPTKPVFSVQSQHGDDLTVSQYDRKPETGDWPDVFRYANGNGFIPASLAHSMAEPPALFNPWHRSETVNATFIAARLSAAIDHGAIFSANPQRNVMGMEPDGGEIVETDGGPVQVMSSDSTAITRWAPSDDGGIQPQHWQWEPSADLETMQMVFEKRLALIQTQWGINPGDLVRQSADPRSGVALALSRAGTREIQNRRAALYRPHDARLVSRVAACMNRLDGGDRPEGGYDVTYALLPLSAQEQSQLVKDARQAWVDGIITAAEYRAVLMGESLHMAQEKLPTAPPPPAPMRA